MQSFSTDYPFDFTGTKIILLYDFNLNVGDTAYWENDIPVLVTEISTSDILGTEKISLKLNNEDEWVYGLGSTQGLYRPISNMFEYGYSFCGFIGNYIDSLGADYTYNLTDLEGDCNLSIKEGDQNSQLKFYPNPATTTIVIESNSEEIQAYTLFDLNGKLLLNGFLTTGKNELNIQNLATGIYFIRIQDAVHILTVK